MDKNIHEQQDEWDSYQTGSFPPPKKHGGLIAVLLVAVIFLGGIASAMSILNIRLFRKLHDTNEDASSLFFSQADDPGPAVPPIDKEAPKPPRSDLTLNINHSPKAVDNVPQEGGLSLQQIYDKSINSVVSINCTLEGSTSSGTGVILSSDGFIVTNSHVIEDAQIIQVIFTNQKILNATVVGFDTISDLAVLHVNAADLTPAEFGDSNSIHVGDLAVAIGDPLGIELRGTMTEGIISAINRDITTGGRTMTLLQTSAALNPGNSGGPLLNCYGQVVGINTMKIGNYTDTANVEGLGFAIPSTTVKEVVDQLIDHGYVIGRPSLGMATQEISNLYQHLYDLPEGLYITEVYDDSDAAAKGISPGDVLISFGGERVTTIDALNSLLYSHEAGDSVVVIIYRSGKSYELSLTIGQAN